MDKPNYKLIDGTATTVAELIELLKKVPGEYEVSLSGMNTFGVVIDTNNKTTLIDDIGFIEDLLTEG